MQAIDHLSEYLSQAILLEVAAAPKPGLVTRHANGAHRDMSILTFAMSSVIVSQAFNQLFAAGKESGELEPSELLAKVRRMGVGAEKNLLRVTKGVNTQRGILFAGGLLAAAGGYLAGKNKNAQDAVDSHQVSQTVAQMTAGLVERELRGKETAGLCTAGEKLFQKYGITGIRGEVETGFASVINVGLPALTAAFDNGVCLNDALVHTLLALMTVVEDSNIIWRSDYDTLRRTQQRAGEVIIKGSIFTSIGRTAIENFDHDCVEHRISPGGSADLLSVTTALYLLDNKEFPTAIM